MGDRESSATIGFVVSSMEKPNELEIRAQHFPVLGDYRKNGDSYAMTKITDAVRALGRRASRLWHWCTSWFRGPSSQYRTTDIDDEAFKLDEDEKVLSNILERMEKAIRETPPSRGGMQCYLAIKSKTQQELQEIDKRRVRFVEHNSLMNIAHSMV